MPPSVRVAALATICSTVAPFQSSESTVQSTSSTSIRSASARTASFVAPNGGRTRFGVPRVMSRSTHWVLAISGNRCASSSVVRSGWVKVWFPTRIPARRSARTRCGRARALLPWLNVVARRPSRFRAFRRSGVVGLGPLSKVRPT